MQLFGEHYSEHRFVLVDVGRGIIYGGCNTFVKLSMERDTILLKHKIGVISAQLYVTFW